MKLQKTITIDISDDYKHLETITLDIDFILSSEEIQAVFNEEKGEIIFLQNINRIASMLKNIPDEIIKNLSKRSYDTLLIFFEEWIDKIKKIRSGL